MDLAALTSDLVAVIAPVFLIAALGFGWARAGLPLRAGPFITTFMINVATPCLVFATLTPAALRGWRTRHAGDRRRRLQCMGLALSAGVAFLLLLRVRGCPTRSCTCRR